MATAREAIVLRARKSLPWFLLALAILVSTLWLIGFEDIRQALSEVAVTEYLLVVGFWALGVPPRALALRRVLSILGWPISALKATVLQLSVAFAHNATPSGQAGGVPASGVFISRASGARYEQSCGAVLSVNVVGSLSLQVLGLLGALYLVSTTVVGEKLQLAMFGTIGLFVVLVGSIVVIWTFRDRFRAIAVGVITSVTAVLGRLPGIPQFDEDDIADRVEGFGESLARVAGGSRRDLAVIIVGVTVGHLFSVVALWTALQSIGVSVSFPLLLAVLPLAYTAAGLPLPGGLGGVQASMTTLIGAASVGAVSGSVAAAVLVFRSVTLWLQTLIGAIAAAIISIFG